MFSFPDAVLLAKATYTWLALVESTVTEGLERMFPSLQRSRPETGQGTSVNVPTVWGKPTCCVRPTEHELNLFSITLLPLRYTTKTAPPEPPPTRGKSNPPGIDTG